MFSPTRRAVMAAALTAACGGGGMRIDTTKDLAQTPAAAPQNEAVANGALTPASTPARAPLLTGVNISGLEFNARRLPGVAGHDYPEPDPLEIAYYYSRGARILRLPFLWERLQPTLGGAFDPPYAARIDSVVALARKLSMQVILDAHQYGRRKMGTESVIIGETPAVTSRHFSQLWGELARRYRGEPVIFGLCNEPHGQDLANLVSIQNDAIAVIRVAAAKNLILVSGGAWSGAHSWVKSGTGDAMLDIRDVDRNTAFDVHQYLDDNSSGTSGQCKPTASSRLEPFMEWARINKKKGFLGEFAGGSDDVCQTELRAMLNTMRDAPDIWKGWTAWGGGAWWPKNYPFALRPEALATPVDRPQMALMRRFFEV